MSSSFGGSGFGGGSSGTIRYQIIIDDSQVNSKLSNIENNLKGLDSAIRGLSSTSQGLNSSIQGLDSATQGLNSATQSTGTGLMNINNDIKSVDSTINKTTTDLDAINSNWQTMKQGAQNASTSVDALGNSFKGAQGGITNADGTLKNWNSSVDTSVQSNKSFGSIIKDNALAIGVTASSIIGLVSSYTDLHAAQLQAERATVVSERANLRLEKATARVNKLLLEGKQGTTEYNLAVKDKALAESQAGIASEKASIATARANEATARFIPQLAQDVILLGSSFATMASGFRDFANAAPEALQFFKSLGPTVLAAAGPLLVAVAGIYSLIGALRAAQKLNDIVTAKLGPGKTNQSVGGAFLDSIFGNEEQKKKAAEYNKQLENNVVTAKEYEQVLKDSFDPSKMLDDITNKVTKSLSNLNKTQSAAADTTTETSKGTDDLTQATQKYIEQANQAGGATVEEQLEFAKFQDRLRNTIPDIKQYTQEMLNLVNVVNQGSQRIGEFNKVGVEFNQVLNTANSAANSAMATKAINDTLKLTKGYKDMLTALNGGDQAVQKFMKDWVVFAQSSRLDIADKLGLKSANDEIDKIIKKATKDLPKKINGIKVKDPFQFEIDQDAVSKAAGKWIAGFDSQISSNDKSADAVVSALKKNLPKGDAGDAMKKFLQKAIDRSDTADYLKKNLKQLEDGSFVLKIPVEGKWQGFGNTRETAGIDQFGESKSGTGIKKTGYTNKQGDTGGTRYSTPLNEKNPFKKWDKNGYLWIWNFETGQWDKAETESSIDERLRQQWTGMPSELTPVSTGGGSNGIWKGTGDKGLNSMVTQAAAAATKIKDLFIQSFMAINKGMTMITSGWSGFTNIMITKTASTVTKDKDLFITSFMEVAKGMDILAKGWSAYMTSFMKNASAAGNGIYKNLHAGFQKVANNSDDLAKHWSVVMQSFMKNASAAGNNIYKNLHAGFQKVANNSDDLAKHFSVVMQSFVKNAKSAASQVNAALAKIHDVDVSINISANKSGFSGFPGGGFNFAKGGIISAARGFTTNGPQLALVGDNPGGREDVVVIPRNAPFNTLQKINRKYGMDGSNIEGSVNQTIILHISGNDIINERNLSKKVRFEIGKNFDKYGSS